MKNVAEETGFDRGAWWLLTAVILTALLVLANTIYTLAQPSDGWQADYSAGQLDHFLGDWPTPLQAGDTISTVAGVDLTGAILGWRQLPAWQEGATIPYTIERNGEPQMVAVQLHTLTPRQIAQAFLYVFRANLPQLSWFVVGLIVFFLRPRNVAARLLLVAGASLTIGTRIGWAATVTGANFVPRPNFYLDFMFDTQWGWLFFPSFILLLLVFPQPLWPKLAQPSYRRRVILFAYLVPTILSLLTAITEIEALALVVLLADALLILGLGITAVIKAYRRTDPVARAQVSWIAFGIAFSIGGTVVGYLLNFFGVISFWEAPLFASFFNWITGLTLPICVAIAILRYRLFDIHLIIRKTVQYGAVTAVLALVYFGTIILLQNLVGQATGEQSPIIIVLSTLLIAAMFNPLRQRIQNVVDRRFFRQKYDAAQVLSQFAQTARDEVEMEALQAELLRVIQETLQPESVAVWFKQSDGKTS